MKGVCSVILILLISTLGKAQILTSSNLPLVIINTNGQQIVDDPRIIAHVGMIDNGPGVRNYLTDLVNDFNSDVTIEIRGSTSQQYPKVSYAFTPIDSAGNKINATPLGLPSESDWILYAPYPDKTLMRNTLAYYLARRMGHYASRTRFVEVVINGNYMGEYELMEKIKCDANRVNIAKLQPDDTSGNDLTGGYIIKIDKTTGSGDSVWYSAYDPWVYFQYHDPDDSSMVQVQRDYIRDYVGKFETALHSSYFADPDSGYRKYADVSSFVDFFLLQELGRTVDGYRSSCYMYKDCYAHNGKLTMGPMWDFNLSYGNADYCGAYDTIGWEYQFNNVCNGYFPEVPFWWGKLLQDTSYQNEVRCRWDDLRQSVLNTDSLNHWIDSIATLLDESEQRNFTEWPILGQYVNWNYYVGATYEDEVNYMKTWIHNRLHWLDNFLPGNCIIIPDTTDTAIDTTDTLGVGLYSLDTRKFSLSPNPATGFVIVRFKEPVTQDVEISVVDVMGRIIEQKKILEGETIIDLDISALNEGAYFLFADGQAQRFVKI